RDDSRGNSGVTFAAIGGGRATNDFEIENKISESDFGFVDAGRLGSRLVARGIFGPDQFSAKPAEWNMKISITLVVAGLTALSANAAEWVKLFNGRDWEGIERYLAAPSG